MIMKYKDFKTMSENEMKSVMGGSKEISTTCTYRCCTHVSGGVCVQSATVAIPNCNAATTESGIWMGCAANPPEPPTCTCFNAN